MIVTSNNNCPHIGKIIPFEALNSINFTELKCLNCKEKLDLWICMFCGSAFCGRYKNRHFYSHFLQNKEHCIGISTLDLSAWCYSCTTKEFEDPGSYIESELINKYIDILCQKKFPNNSNNVICNVSNSISPEESNQIKYENFIELLKNNKIKKGICLLGSHIYNKKNNINLFQDCKEDIVKKICEKHQIKENEIDIPKLFKEKPELLYEYLSCFNVDIQPNKIHKFLKFLCNLDIIQTIITENIDGLEKEVGIPSEKIIQITGNLYNPNCFECNELIDQNDIKECIKSAKIKKCQKCKAIYKPNIFFEDVDISNNDLYNKILYKDNYDVCFIIGSNLNRKSFSLITETLAKKNIYIIFINDSKDSKVNLDFDSVFNSNIYLTFDYLDKIYNSLRDANLAKLLANEPEFERYITYKEDLNGNISSPLLNDLRNWNNKNYNSYSIFENNSEKYETEIKYIKHIMENFINTKNMDIQLTILESGALGTMLGMAIADSMGHRFEFEPVRYDIITLRDMGKGRGGAFQLLPGQWTDDTSMGLCLADSLIKKNGEYDAHDLMHRFLSWWNCGYNNAFRLDDTRSHSVGLGGQINGSFDSYIENPKKLTSSGDINSSGIGSIMRNAAVPVCYHNNIEKAMEIAKLQSLLTHQGNEAAECCRLLTFIIVKILKRKEEVKLNDIINNLEEFKTPVNSVKCLALSKEESEDPDRDWNWKKKEFRYSPKRSHNQPGYVGSYAMDGMAMALHIVYYTTSFQEAIIKVANLCGDSDSVGAVVGQIAGAYYGVENIPPEWIETIKRWDDFEIPLRGYILSKLNK